MNDNLLPLTRVIQETDHAWLIENAFEYFVAVETSVNEGATPMEIQRHILRHTYDGRLGLAVRCKNAADYMIRTAA